MSGHTKGPWLEDFDAGWDRLYHLVVYPDDGTIVVVGCVPPYYGNLAKVVSFLSSPVSIEWFRVRMCCAGEAAMDRARAKGISVIAKIEGEKT